MDFTINLLLPKQITKLSHNLVIPDYVADAQTLRLAIGFLSKWIDELGEESAAAQGLSRVITSTDKLRKSPDHMLFLLKIDSCCQGKGAVVGLLKVGYKKLYLFDLNNKVREVEPLCVLDFYISAEHQRLGLGRILFDYMLADMETHPYELAIDGPSPKMEKFLAKNYGIDKLVRQNNNFAVAPQFFDNVMDNSSKSGRNTPAIVPPVGRFAAPKPGSAIAQVIHGGASSYDDSNNGYVRAYRAMNSH